MDENQDCDSLTIVESSDNIYQVDGNQSCDSYDNSHSGDDKSESDVSNVSWDDEAYSAPVRAVLVPAPALPGAPAGTPPGLTVDTSGKVEAPSCLPLGIVTNARSLKMKMKSLRTMLRQVGPDYMNICETFEATRFSLERSPRMEHYKVISYKRPYPKVGGGAAIIYTEQNFFVEEARVPIENGVEACWAIFTPKYKQLPNIHRICVGSIYISPGSKYKQESIDHIIDVMFQMKAQFGNQVNFHISGDFNKYPVSDILSANGALKQVVSVATRKSAILEVILTDLATLYSPPTSLPPLEVDEGMKGSASDHNIIVFAPRTNTQFKKERQFTSISYRPLPPSRIQEFGQEIVRHSWIEVLECEDGHQKAAHFHGTITRLRDKYFPEKVVKMSSMDKEWMHPHLKSIYTDMTREYFNHRKSDRWKRLYRKFRKAKRKAIRGTHMDVFADQILRGTRGNFYKQVRKV